MNIQTTTIVRDRYQITIPKEVRKVLDWLEPQAVITFVVTNNKELVIKPYNQDKR